MVRAGLNKEHIEKIIGQKIPAPLLAKPDPKKVTIVGDTQKAPEVKNPICNCSTIYIKDNKDAAPVDIKDPFKSKKYKCNGSFSIFCRKDDGDGLKRFNKRPDEVKEEFNKAVESYVNTFGSVPTSFHSSIGRTKMAVGAPMANIGETEVMLHYLYPELFFPKTGIQKLLDTAKKTVLSTVSSIKKAVKSRFERKEG